MSELAKFTMAAMQGLLANPEIMNATDVRLTDTDRVKSKIAKAALDIAKATLNELNEDYKLTAQNTTELDYPETPVERIPR